MTNNKHKQKNFGRWLIILSLAILLPAAALAAVNASLPTIKNPFDDLQVKIPGMERFSEASVTAGAKGIDISINWIGEYLIAFYNYAISIIGVFAVVGMAIGGVIWVVSMGNPSMVGMGKEWVVSSLLGLILALGSYIILNTISEDFVQFKPISLAYIQERDLPDITDYTDMANDGTNFSPYSGPKNIVTIIVDSVDGPKRVQVDQSLSDELQGAMTELKNIGFPVKGIGGYRPGSKFCHGRGLAVDINVPENYCVDCYRQKGVRVGAFYRPADGPGANSDYQPSPYSVTQQVVNILKKHGFCWGGDWRGFKDYMHFSSHCSSGECAQSGKYNFGQSVRSNHATYGISYP